MSNQYIFVGFLIVVLSFVGGGFFGITITENEIIKDYIEGTIEHKPYYKANKIKYELKKLREDTEKREKEIVDKYK